MKTLNACLAASFAALTSTGMAQVDAPDLTPLANHILWEKGTERAFTGAFWNHFENGEYRCINCDALLFKSDTKFESHCGWPSFSEAVPGALNTTLDLSHGMRRTEVTCAQCGGHMGHVFEDGPAPTGLRYCINSAVLHFDSAETETPRKPER